MRIGWLLAALAIPAVLTHPIPTVAGSGATDGAGGSPQDSTEAFRPFEQRAYRLVNSITFEPDDQAMFVTLFYGEALAHRGRPDSTAAELGLFRTSRLGTGWGEPELLPFSGSYSDYEPALSPDGSVLLFNSKRPYPDGRVPEHNDLWMAERADGVWGEARPLASVNSFDREESYPTIDRYSRVVYVRGPTSPDLDDYDLYETSLLPDGSTAEPQRLPFSDGRFGEGDPQLARDGTFLIFTRWDRELGWQASCDLYVAFRRGDAWSEPVPLTDLNTPGADFAAALSSDERWLYYRAGGRLVRRPLAPVIASARARSG
jgi:hypothetical protein